MAKINSSVDQRLLIDFGVWKVFEILFNSTSTKTSIKRMIKENNTNAFDAWYLIFIIMRSFAENTSVHNKCPLERIWDSFNAKVTMKKALS